MNRQQAVGSRQQEGRAWRQQAIGNRQQEGNGGPLVVSLFRAFVILSVLLALTSAAGATVLTSTMKTHYFDVRYDPADKYLAESTADTAQDELVRISKLLGYKIEPDRPFPLWIYRTHYSFIKEGGLDDRFTVGTARTGDERISVDASGAFVEMKQVLGHEITHAVIFRILGNRASTLPLWANEGLAKIESEQFSETDNVLVTDAASNLNLITLSDLATKFPSNRADLAYAESASAMRFLVKRYGDSAPKTMLAELAKTGSFDKAMLKATGDSEGAFVSNWTKSLNRRYWVLRVWQIGGAFGGAIMAGLAVWAFIIRRRKMAEAARQWEWEQFEESMERQLREWPHR